MRVRGNVSGEAMVGGVLRDLGLGSMSLENPCEMHEKHSSPFSSNRTMFETEEVPATLTHTHTLNLHNLSPHKYTLKILSNSKCLELP